MSTENDLLDQFLESLWRAIDQICVPAIMMNYESVENPAVFTNFFQILHLSVSPASACRESFARKLTSGSFVRLSLEIKEKFGRREQSKELTEAIARFLPELCLALGNASEKTQLRDRLRTSNIGGIYAPFACLNLLAQSSVRLDTNEIIDEPLFNTQCFCIELMYVSISNGDELVPVEELMMGLHKYLVLHPDLTILPSASLKHLLFLWITSCNRLSSLKLAAAAIESMHVSQGILEQCLVKFKAEEFETIYIHDLQFVSWIFSCESLAQAFGRQVLICFMETEETPNSSSDNALHQLLASNLQSFQTFVSLVDCSEEGIVNRIVTVLEALITENSDSDPSAKMNTPLLSSLASHIANIFRKLFLGHKANPLQDHSILAMLKVMTAVQMNILAFDIKLLYHVINLLTSTKSCQRFTIAAINYLNVTIAWDLTRDGHRIAMMLLSNKALCDFIQEILDTKLVQDPGQRTNSLDDTNLLASVLVLISSLAISQPQAHKDDAYDPFKFNKRCMVTLANERRSILGIASLVFWDVFFRTTARRSDKLLVVLTEIVYGKEQLVEELSEVDLQVLHVYLQNSLVHDSETVRQCAVKCMGSFLSHVPDASAFVSNPWNRIVLESQLSVLSVNVVTPSSVLFCLLILQHTSNTHHFTDVVQTSVKSILDRIPSIPCSEQDLSWHCIDLLVELLSSGDNIMSQDQKGDIRNWLVTFKESLSHKAKRNVCSDEDFKFFKLEDVIFTKDLLKANIRSDPELLTKAIHLLQDKPEG